MSYVIIPVTKMRQNPLVAAWLDASDAHESYRLKMKSGEIEENGQNLAIYHALRTRAVEALAALDAAYNNAFVGRA